MGEFMPTISFSAVEILPALLSHKKTQTIRPLWRRKTEKDDPNIIGTALESGNEGNYIKIELMPYFIEKITKIYKIY